MSKEQMKFNILVLISIIFFYEVRATTQVWSTVNGADGIVADTYGNLFVSSSAGNVIYQLYEGFGTPVKFAGTGSPGLTDGNAFSDAEFNQPRGIAMKDNGDIYVADYGNNAIRIISGGVVSTLITDIPSPIDVSIVGPDGQYSTTYSYWYWENSDTEFVNPWGIYVTTEGGTIYFVNEGPANDDCPFATPVTLNPSSPVVIRGTTLNAHGETFVPTCPPGSQSSPVAPAWYSFMGNGNQVNVTTCGFTQTGSGVTFVFVYRDTEPTDAPCSNLYCMGENYQSSCGTVTLCTQTGINYYVVVSTPYESEEGTFQLTITDTGASACTNCTCDNVQCGPGPCNGYCGNSTATCPKGKGCVNSQCEPESANAVCSGAVAFTQGNQTISGNTQSSFGTAPYIPSTGACKTPTSSGLWYSFVGTGNYVTLSTCSPNTNFDTIIHVYESIGFESCSDVLCIATNDNHSCNGKDIYSSLEFCAGLGNIYYYFVEGYDHGEFDLIQTTSTEKCTPGDYWGYWYWYWVQEPREY